MRWIVPDRVPSQESVNVKISMYGLSAYLMSPWNQEFMEGLLIKRIKFLILQPEADRC